MPEQPIPEAASPQQPLLLASAKGECPQCGAPTLFDGPVKFADHCRACGLNYGQFNVGDGPAAFLTLIVGGIIVALALIVEVNWRPPIWLHAILWVPLTIVSVVGALRVAKGALLILEYKNKAREGTLVKPDGKK